MKNKLGKKLLVGGACACLMLTGGLTLTGCSLTDEQQKALDVLVQNTETLVTDFGSYLDGQNAKIDKEKAAEMIARSRLNFEMSNFEHLEMNVVMNMFEGFEDKLVYEASTKSLFRSENGVKIYAYYDEGEILDLSKSDFNEDYHYKYSNYDEESFNDNLDYFHGMWSMHSADIFSQAPMSYIGKVTADDIYNIKTIEDGYEFEIVTGLSTLTETDLSKYKDGDSVEVFNIIMKVELKNGYMTKVSFNGNQITVPVVDLMTEMTGENSTIVLDDKGMPTIDTYVNSIVTTMVIDVEYKYENIDYSSVDAKIAEIEATYLTQE